MAYRICQAGRKQAYDGKDGRAHPCRHGCINGLKYEGVTPYSFRDLKVPGKNTDQNGNSEDEPDLPERVEDPTTHPQPCGRYSGKCDDGLAEEHQAHPDTQ